jgi:hypothetical protein
LRKNFDPRRKNFDGSSAPSVLPAVAAASVPYLKSLFFRKLGAMMACLND